MSVSVKTSHLAPARFSKISFGLTETHPSISLVYMAQPVGRYGPGQGQKRYMDMSTFLATVSS